MPLTEARNGSLSTRTTHPHFMTALGQCVAALGLTNPISNPFRIMTKGETASSPRSMARRARSGVRSPPPERSAISASRSVAGIHTGKCEVIDNKVGGIAVGLGITAEGAL